MTTISISKRNPLRGHALVLLLILLSCAIITLLVGDTPFPKVWDGLISRLNGSSNSWNPLLDERLPRLIVILCTGASLAVSGAVMQALFQNPLASPSILGISSGGSLLVLPIILMEWHLNFPFAIPMASFLGCILTLLLVYAISLFRGNAQISTLILTGIAISTLFLSIQGTLIYALRDRWELIQMLTEWEAGSTSDRTWRHVHMQLPLTLVGLWGCWYYAKEIDILSLGDEEAKSLGVEVTKVRWRLFLCVALLTGGAIAAIGIIAFFGLILPHIIRKLYGPKNQYMILLCILMGSSTLAAMDIFLRIMEIHAFSIGNISAILGGLFFLVLLMKTRNQQAFSNA